MKIFMPQPIQLSGSIEVSLKFHLGWIQGFSQIPDWFQKDSRKVPVKFKHGSRKVPIKVL